MAIIINILVLSIENNNFNDLEFFIDVAKKIPATPELFFYKNVLLFFENFIQYKTDNDRKYLKECEGIIHFLRSSGMAEYANELTKFKSKYE